MLLVAASIRLALGHCIGVYNHHSSLRDTVLTPTLQMRKQSQTLENLPIYRQKQLLDSKFQEAKHCI